MEREKNMTTGRPLRLIVTFEIGRASCRERVSA